MKKGNWKWTIACFMMLIVVFVGGIAVSAADEVITVGVTCTYGQSEARRMLDMINEFRTGGTAWRWDESSTTKVPCTGLGELIYDYGLEQTAMQRAAEIALSFSHTRPNGDSCFTAYEGRQGAKGENIAAGRRTAETTFDQWKEEEENYGGQGHRRNMLSSSFQYIGIGHVVYNGYHYWVQEFGNMPTGVSAPEEADVEKEVPVEVLSSGITKKSVTASQEAITLGYGDMADLPEITCKIQLTGAWPGGLCMVTLADLANVWTVSSGADCISIDAGTARISADKCGEAQIAAEVWGQPLAVPVTVTPKSMADAEVTLDKSQLTYTGAAITPSTTVSLDGEELEAGTDYIVSYKNNIDAGTASVIVSGTGNYVGEIAQTFEIARAELEADDCTFAKEKDVYVYTGEEVKPAVAVQHDGRTLTEEQDYSVSYQSNIDAGIASVFVTGEGNYSGTLLKTFEIGQAALTEDTCEIELIPDQEYAGTEITPAVTVRWNGKILEQGTDYAVTYKNNKEVGTAQAEIQGMGNFTDGCAASFEITKASLEKGTVTVEEQTFTGTELTPDVTVSLGDVLLEENVDYTVEGFDNNTDAGEASVTVTGTGNYTGTLTGKFTILPLSISGSEFTLGEIAAETYSGDEIRPGVVLYRDGTALEEGRDYRVTYEDNINAGTADVTVTGAGNYAGTKTVKFQILPLDLGQCSVSAQNQTFTGKPLEPSVEVMLNGRALVSGTDYTASADGNHTGVGTVDVLISGTGNYCGIAAGSFEILPANIADCQVSEIAEQTYTGHEIQPDVTVSLGDYVLTEVSDYTITYEDNIGIGEAGITLIGNGNFEGEQYVTFKIVPIDLSKAAFEDIPDQTYTGEQITPSVTVSMDGTELEEGTDYTVSYADNINAGTAAVTAMGTGKYSGICTATFTIKPLTIFADECTVGTVEDQIYTGEQIIPAVEVLFGEKTLVQGIDYAVVCENNIDAGNVNGTIEGVGNYTGEIGKIAFQILPADLSGCTMEQIPAQTFEGSAVEPPVTVHFGSIALTKDVDFSVSYENNAAVGTAKAVITGKGNYTGTLAGNFEIIEKQAQSEQDTPTAPDSQMPDTPTAPDSQMPDMPTTSKPGLQESGLAIGAVKKDSTSAAKYKVKGNAGGVPTVEYVAPISAKKTSVTIPDTVKIGGVKCRVVSIAANAFRNNTKIRKVTIGKYVKSIGKNAFQNCTRLKTLKLGANVTAINDSAFYGCKSLESVTIPSSVMKIGKLAFYNCPKLKTITVKTKKLTQKTVGQKAFSKISSKAVIKVPGSKKKLYKEIFQKRGVGKKVKIK